MHHQEFNQIVREIECHHGIFSTIWQFGKPRFTEEIDTAAVLFDRKGNCFDFIFNTKFWDKCSEYEKKFVICHEMLHVILNHGYRLQNHKGEVGNICADVVVNEMLVKSFGFDRSKITLDACWLDNVFAGKKDIRENESLEYYLSKVETAEGFSTLDNHNGLSELSEDANEVLGKAFGKLSEEEQDSLRKILEQNSKEYENCQAGSAAAGILSEIHAKRSIKKKWETVIKKWSQKYIKDHTEEQWVLLNRRFVLLSDDMIIPTEMEFEEEENDKIEVWFFQDCSGSCWGLKDRFFQAALSLPPKKFSVKMHTFDTDIYEADINQHQVWGGGGTSFSIIENYIQAHIRKNNVSYPKAVFVLTDGYGDSVSPQIPKNWFWFLSHMYTHFIPKESKIFKLSDYE